MNLITIVCEAHARGPVTALLHELGAHGYTLFTVEGSGSKGQRVADIQEFANIQIEVIVPPAVAEQILVRIEKDFLRRYAMVVYESDVRVLRPHKF